MRKTTRSSAVCLVAALLFGCRAASLLESHPGADISSIKAGLTREQVEARVGVPSRDWVTPTGVRYFIYLYDAGYEAQPVAAAGVAVVMFLAIITTTPGPEEVWPGRDRYAWLAVSYDKNDVVLGVFPNVKKLEPANFPDDGLPAPAR